MLEELHVVNMGVVEDLTIELGPGMTVISGETGAGKTLIVGALSLLLGSRADTNLLRTGEELARVEARFIHEGQETVVIRHVASGDRSRAYVNGSVTRVADLGSVTSSLVDIYGQHQAQSLFSPAAQAAVLDCFSSIEYSEINELRDKLREANRRLSSLGGDERSRHRELSLCQMELNEITNAGLFDPLEEEALKRELEILTNSHQYKESLEMARTLLLEGEIESSAMDKLGEARSHLLHKPIYAPLVDALSEQIMLLGELGREIHSQLDLLDSDPARLEEIHKRLQLLSGLKKRYGNSLSEVIKYRESLVERINDLSSYEIVAAKMETEISDIEKQISRCESEILERRRSASPVLSREVQKRLSLLAMPNARFEIAFGDSNVGDPITFLFSSNSGERLAPVSKIASGGELSRIMLALRLVVGSDVPTMVFDEVDAGVAGKSALSVGQALAELSKTKQVIVVTHLAQVAAFAQRQIGITKVSTGGRTVTKARVLIGEERIAELARMLSGHGESESAKQHARELLISAGNL